MVHRFHEKSQELNLSDSSRKVFFEMLMDISATGIKGFSRGELIQILSDNIAVSISSWEYLVLKIMMLLPEYSTFS